MAKIVYTKNAPDAIGPYSQAVVTGNLVFTSGQIAINPASGNVEVDTIEGQTEQICKNLTEVLKEAGSSMEKVVKTVCFLADMGDFAKFNEVYGKYFISKPARSCVAVKTLPKNVLAEVEVIAEISYTEEKMNIILYSNKIDEYLKHDNVIDYNNESIIELADKLFQKADNELDFIKKAYEFVRDNISHSADINEDTITCAASEVLKAGHGICFAKSHLLAALLRCKDVPAGFCYQKLILDDETAPILVYHGLNGVYIKDCKKWIRLDARGNKTGVNAQFSIELEQLAFPIRPNMGEVDSFIVYPAPDIKILEKLQESKTRTKLWDNLPTELEYNK